MFAFFILSLISMLLLLVSSLSFLLLTTKPHLPSWVSEMSLLSLLIFKESLHHSIHFFKLSTNNNNNTPRIKNEESSMNVLDLPELTLDLIFKNLSPTELMSMSNTCTSLRQWCKSDHLWERHFKKKWGNVMGQAARREWEAYSVSARDDRLRSCWRPNWLCNWALPCSWFLHERQVTTRVDADDSVMAWYLALESGRFWFPAQVYNREVSNGITRLNADTY